MKKKLNYSFIIELISKMERLMKYKAELHELEKKSNECYWNKDYEEVGKYHAKMRGIVKLAKSVAKQNRIYIPEELPDYEIGGRSFAKGNAEWFDDYETEEDEEEVVEEENKIIESIEDIYKKLAELEIEKTKLTVRLMKL
jgi:hypothetical protein